MLDILICTSQGELYTLTHDGRFLTDKPYQVVYRTLIWLSVFSLGVLIISLLCLYVIALYLPFKPLLLLKYINT